MDRELQRTIILFHIFFSSVTYFIRLHSCCTTICNHKFTGCSSQINLLPFSCQFMRRPTDLLFASRHPVGATGQNYMQGKVLAVMALYARMIVVSKLFQFKKKLHYFCHCYHYYYLKSLFYLFPLIFCIVGHKQSATTITHNWNKI